MRRPFLQIVSHLAIRSQWKHWIFPLFCMIPYLLALLWLVSRNQFWIAQVMLAPLVMMFAVISMALLLAKIEFRR